ncbi:MAG TPA: YciI family protein [Aggregatilineales bacterium]|nr:YciI family protein [Aggregatilineales bacterium]
MAETSRSAVYFVVFCVTAFPSFEDARGKAPDLIAAHIARSKELHTEGTLLMAGAFVENPDEPLTTMGVLTSREAAEDYIKGDPFVQNGLVKQWTIRKWANMFGSVV